MQIDSDAVAFSQFPLAPASSFACANSVRFITIRSSFTALARKVKPGWIVVPQPCRRQARRKSAPRCARGSRSSQGLRDPGRWPVPCASCPDRKTFRRGNGGMSGRSHHSLPVTCPLRTTAPFARAVTCNDCERRADRMTTDIDSNALASSGAGGRRAFSPCPLVLDSMGMDDMSACGRAAARGGGS